MTSAPRILILLATYNGRQYLPEQIESICAQHGVQPIVHVCDDASIDGTPELAREILTASGIEYDVAVNARPSGSAARNFFRLIAETDLSRADYVALCDQDDIWHPSKLRRAVERLEAEKADFYSSNSLPFWPDGRRGFIAKDYPQRRYDFLFESASHGCTYVFTRDAAIDLQRFVAGRIERLHDIAYHDWLIYAWARLHEYRWTMDDRALIDYRQSGANVIGANVGLCAFRRRAALLRDGWLRHQSLLIAAALDLPESGVVARLTRFGWRDRLALAAASRSFRRRPRDAVVLLLSMLLGRRTAARI